MNNQKLKRNVNIECLRIISIVMITFLHAIAKSDMLIRLTGSGMQNPNAWIAWIIDILCIGAVNIFMLISGYFLVETEFKLGRLVEIIAEILFYSVGTLIVCYIFGFGAEKPGNVYDFLNYVFPVHMNVYWFMTAYVLVYILQPVLSKGLKAISQKSFRLMLILLVIYECIVKSVLPVRMSVDTQGYTFFWYIIVFMIGAYFRLYGFGRLEKKKVGLLLYVGCSLLNLVLVVGIQHVVLHMNHLKELEDYSLEYNHVLVLLAAVGIFSVFAQRKEREGKGAELICFLSPMALGVYLLQENLQMRYEWQKWFGLTDSLSDNPFLFLAKLIAAVLIVYAVGTLVDYLRLLLFGIVKKL